MSSLNIATIQSTGDQVQDMQNLFDAYARLRKELIHGLSFLDDENVPMLKTIVGDIEGAFTAIEQTEETITLLATDVAGNTSAISVQAGQIQSLVTSVSGQSSAITQLSNEISLKVDSGDYTASVIVSMINGSSVTIDAENINLNGITTMSGLTYVAEQLNMGLAGTTGTKMIRFIDGASISNTADVYGTNKNITISAPEVRASNNLNVGGYLTTSAGAEIYSPTNHNLVAKFG